MRRAAKTVPPSNYRDNFKGRGVYRKPKPHKGHAWSTMNNVTTVWRTNINTTKWRRDVIAPDHQFRQWLIFSVIIDGAESPATARSTCWRFLWVTSEWLIRRGVNDHLARSGHHVKLKNKHFSVRRRLRPCWRSRPRRRRRRRRRLVRHMAGEREYIITPDAAQF